MRSAEFVQAWGATGLPDEATDVPVCSEVGGDIPMCVLPARSWRLPPPVWLPPVVSGAIVPAARP